MENQDIYEELQNSIKLSLGFLKGKDAKIKSMEEEISLLNDDINKDASQGYDIQAKTKKLDSLEKSLYDYETLDSDVLLECTHINNINNCILKINGNRVETFGDAKKNYESDMQNKSKISLIIEDMEKELAKIKEENDIKQNLRNKIVKSELHVNGLNSRIKLYNDKYSNFVEKEDLIKKDLYVEDEVMHNLVGEISGLNDEIKSLNEELNTAKSNKAKLIEDLETNNKKLKDSLASEKELGKAVTNDISNIESIIVEIENKIKNIDLKINKLNKNLLQNNLKLKKSNEELKKYKAKQPLYNSSISFLNSQLGELETYDNINDLWKEKFSLFKSNIEDLSKEIEYPFSNANGAENSTVNPLIEYTEKLNNMISYIKEKGLNDDNETGPQPVDLSTEVITPVKSKINPFVIGAIALGGALILTNNK